MTEPHWQLLVVAQTKQAGYHPYRCVPSMGYKQPTVDNPLHQPERPVNGRALPSYFTQLVSQPTMPQLNAKQLPTAEASPSTQFWHLETPEYAVLHFMQHSVLHSQGGTFNVLHNKTTGFGEASQKRPADMLTHQRMSSGGGRNSGNPVGTPV